MSSTFDLEPKVRRASTNTLHAAFTAAARLGLPKHLQLSNAIIDLVRNGSLEAGDQIPPEQQLGQSLGISLGTVQKSLNRLAIEGWVVREHGRGTFVSRPDRATEDVRFYRYLDHFRFLDSATGEPLPVYSTLISRNVVESDPQLVQRLGRDPAGFVEIVRRIDLGSEFSCRSLMYLGATRFGGLLSLPSHAFDNVNLKQIFSDHFGAPTFDFTQTVKLTALSGEDASFLNVSAGTGALVLEIVARTHQERPLSFQRVLIPSSRHALDMSPPVMEMARRHSAGPATFNS